jgi:putative acetyltransferase
MITIAIIKQEQAAEARLVIYSVAHDLFHEYDSLEESISGYSRDWPLHDLDDLQKNYFDNGGTFLVLSDEGKIVGTGALNKLEEGVAELRRLWFLREYQGKGLGYQMVLQLLAFARQNGYSRVRLETNPEFQTRAYELYKRMGFYEIPAYGDENCDIGMELILS